MTKEARAIKVHTFVWEGINRRGERVQGELNAESTSVAKNDLLKQGVIPKRLKRKSKFLSGFRNRKIKPKDIAHFSRQMSTMLDAGIPLVQSFEIVQRGLDNENYRRLIGVIKTDVEGGSTFAESLTKHPKYFNELYTSLVAAGEQSGSLDSMLEKIATYREKIESIKGKIKKALFYPAAVLVVAIGVTIGLLVFVVPQFESLFKGFGADLPMPTRVVINLSEIMQQIWWLILIAVGIFIYMFNKLMQKSIAFRERMEEMSLRIPIIGEIINKAAISRFTRTLAITFAAGIPLVDAFKAVAGATGNAKFVKATDKIREQVATGQSLQNAIKSVDLFPQMVVQMISIGEESGNLELMLNKVSDYYEEEVDNAVEGLSSLIEPMIMVVLGVLIGGLVIAMYMPIFKMGSVI